MIETCPKKRMVFGIALLTLVTIIVLIVESRWTESPRQQKQFVVENNSTCYLREEYEIIQDCHPCTAFEIASKTHGVCVHTHNKEILRCKSGETVSRSCDTVAWVDKQNFWAFEVILTIIGALSTSVTFLRRQSLDRRIMIKVQRQLEQSV